MKIKENFLLRKISDSYIVVPVGDAVVDFSGLINLNETGALLFETMQKGCDEEELVKILLQKYDVSEEIARADVRAFVKKAKEADILE